MNVLTHRTALVFVLAILVGAAGAAEVPRSPDMDPSVVVPPAPILSPEQALAALRAAPGLRVELAAAEPAVVAPVAIAFDADGRLWVVEMRGYMLCTEMDKGRKSLSKGEELPLGRVAVLDDVDGDGRFEHRVDALEGLVMPRAIACALDGMLVGEPPELRLYRLSADGARLESPVRVTGYGVKGGNPEHMANSPLRGIDNWYRSANHPERQRPQDGAWTIQPDKTRSQWGLSQDDHGRLFGTNNSAPVLRDPLPAWATPDPAAAGAAGVQASVARRAKGEVAVPSIRPTPGAQGGHEKGTLRPDGRLAQVTATCGLHCYRGGIFPDGLGDVFTPEPVGNVLLRFRIVAKPDGGDALPVGPEAALASMDERFRPVNCATGPDGALYVVDMARGVVQWSSYMTPFLLDQIRARKLNEGTDLGRIWRVLPAQAQRGPRPRLSRAGAAELVGHLGHANGWWRDTSQRLLVERGMREALPALRELLRTGAPIARLHALWTIEGLGGLDEATLATALDDADETMRAAGVRLSLTGPLPAGAAAERALTMHGDTSVLVRATLAANLGNRTDAPAAQALDALAKDKVGMVAKLAAWAASGKGALPPPP